MAQKDRKTGLTPKQDDYCKKRAEGLTQRQAYKASHPNDKSKDVIIDQNACRLEANNNVLTRIEYYRKEAEKGAILDIQAKQALLSSIALNTDVATADRIRAVDISNKMSGLYSESRLQVSVTGNMDITQEAAKKAIEALNPYRATDTQE